MCNQNNVHCAASCVRCYVTYLLKDTVRPQTASTCDYQVPKECIAHCKCNANIVKYSWLGRPQFTRCSLDSCDVWEWSKPIGRAGRFCESVTSATAMVIYCYARPIHLLFHTSTIRHYLGQFDLLSSWNIWDAKSRSCSHWQVAWWWKQRLANSKYEQRKFHSSVVCHLSIIYDTLGQTWKLRTDNTSENLCD